MEESSITIATLTVGAKATAYQKLFVGTIRLDSGTVKAIITTSVATTANIENASTELELIVKRPNSSLNYYRQEAPKEH